jgi:hypothetical protein
LKSFFKGLLILQTLVCKGKVCEAPHQTRGVAERSTLHRNKKYLKLDLYLIRIAKFVRPPIRLAV